MKTQKEMKAIFRMFRDLGKLKALKDASKDTFEIVQLGRKIKKLQTDIEKETGFKP